MGAALVDGLFWGGGWRALGIDNYVGVVVPVANEGMIVRGVVWAHALLHPFAVSMAHAWIVSLCSFVIGCQGIWRRVAVCRLGARRFCFDTIFWD